MARKKKDKDDSEDKGKRMSVYISPKVQKELDKIKEEYGIDDDKVAYAIYVAQEHIGEDKLKSEPDDTEEETTTKKRSKRKSSTQSVSKAIDEVMAQGVEAMGKPLVDGFQVVGETVKKQMKDILVNKRNKTEEVEEHGNRERVPTVPITTVRNLLSKKEEEVDRKVQEEIKRRNFEKDFKELKEQVEYLLGGGVLTEAEKMEMFSNKLKELGYTKEDKKELYSVIKDVAPDILDVINNFIKGIDKKSIQQLTLAQLQNMMSIIDIQQERLERRYKDGGISQENYEKMLLNLNEALSKIFVTAFSQLVTKPKVSSEEEDNEEEMTV